jgi:hypothetical protein
MKLVVRIRLLSADEGMRNPIRSGYWADWIFGEVNPDGLPVLHSARIVVLTPDPLRPGPEGDAEIVPLHPKIWPDLHPGATLAAHEGPRRVATATLVRRID